LKKEKPLSSSNLVKKREPPQKKNGGAAQICESKRQFKKTAQGYESVAKIGSQKQRTVRSLDNKKFPVSLFFL